MMQHTIQVFDLPAQQDTGFLDNVIIPVQTHSNNIVEIKTGSEDLQDCDGMFTAQSNTFTLGIQTADCAAICFSDQHHYGIIHAGWRGLVNGIIEDMLDRFVDPQVFVSPLIHEFEIQQDYCYEQIREIFGEQYFYLKKDQQKTILMFQFLEALQSVLPSDAVFDGRDTFTTPTLASWRRDGGGTRNYTLIYGNDG